MYDLVQLQNKIECLRTQGKLFLQNGDIGHASAPSNIALIKYWGKEPEHRQIPLNSSLSFTLNHLKSETTVRVLGRFFPQEMRLHAPKIKHQFFLNGQCETSEKINHFLNDILFPYATDIALYIESRNHFPTACGIASSASGYAALCKAIANLLQLEKHFTPDELQHWIYEWARLGSGSATRSACLSNEGLFVAWQRYNMQTQTLAVAHHPHWAFLQHAVFILDESQKEISSSQGHQYAQSSPLNAIRLAGIDFKMDQLKKALLDCDFQTVADISEADAFAMHSVMQTGKRPLLYLNDTTSEIIAHFISFRNKKQLKSFWTLDAGPNIHFLFFPEAEKDMLLFHTQMEKQLNRHIRMISSCNI